MGDCQNVASDEAGVAPDSFEGRCVDFFAEVVQVLGVPKSVGQIYGLLFAVAEPLSFSDIAGRLALSRGSVSQGLHVLRALGAIRTVEAKEGKRERFVPELGLRKLVAGVLADRIGPIARQGDEGMRELKELARRRTDPAGRRFAEERVRQLQAWQRQLRLLLPLLKTMLGPVR